MLFTLVCIVVCASCALSSPINPIKRAPKPRGGDKAFGEP